MKRGGGLRPPTKGRLAVHRRVTLHVYISFHSIYAYKISDFHLNNQKRGAFVLMPGPFPDPGGVNPYICISLYFIFMSSMHTKFQLSILINKKKMKKGAFGPPQRAVSRSIGELSYMYKYFFTLYVRTKFQISILIIKIVEPSAPCQGSLPALGALVHTFAYHCILFSINIMHTKIQPSILINKQVRSGDARSRVRLRFVG